MFEAVVVSCSEKVYVDSKTNERRVYYKVYLTDEKGDIGSVTSNEPYKPAQKIRLAIRVDSRTGKFTVRVA